MNLTAKGKVGRLDTARREEVNLRLENGETAGKVAAWLNSLPEVQAMLAAEFGGRPVNEVNVCKWRKFGFKNWRWRREAEKMAESRQYQLAAAPPLTEQMAGWVSVHYLMAVQQLMEMHDSGKPNLKLLREFCRDVVALRRGELGEGRLKFNRERLAWRNQVKNKS